MEHIWDFFKGDQRIPPSMHSSFSTWWNSPFSPTKRQPNLDLLPLNPPSPVRDGYRPNSSLTLTGETNIWRILHMEGMCAAIVSGAIQKNIPKQQKNAAERFWVNYMFMIIDGYAKSIQPCFCMNQILEPSRNSLTHQEKKTSGQITINLS